MIAISFKESKILVIVRISDEYYKSSNIQLNYFFLFIYKIMGDATCYSDIFVTI